MKNLGKRKVYVSDVDTVSKWVFSSTGIGRDAAFNLVSLFLLTYIQFTMGLTVAQFSALTAIIVLCRIWDGINDPLMGMIIENTHTRWGKFKPWILIGAILNGFIIISLFFIRPEGWNFVIFFGIAYLLWGMTFTMNDIAYWSMLPSLSSEPRTRDQLTTLVALFANVGAFLVGGLVPILTTGNMVAAYRNIAILVGILFIICQVLCVLLVKEKPDKIINDKPKVSFTKMFKLIKRNDQLLWITIALFLHYLLQSIINALGINMFYFEFGYDGTNMTIFIAVYAIISLISTAVYPLLTKKLTRMQIVTYAFWLSIVGFIIFFLTGYVPFIPHNIISFCIAGVFIFAGYGLIYLVILVQFSNTIEYDEYLTGERNESVTFSLRPLTAKISGAFQQAIVTIVLISSGIYGLSRKISQLEFVKDLTINARQEQADAIIGTATNDMLLVLRIGIAIVPLILEIFVYYIIRKKYLINENVYESMMNELELRKQDPNHFDNKSILESVDKKTS
ncbi:melibiose:sodium transporter MelB [Vallitalea longa]|uniref:Melibiose:sodium transporter MelB n=1 Tax=Vallitalea longa TaxID=2936439 RepID=A0A9W5Y956_9FIRM|nr:glycoside-pentoside-hexuronide (GPH):cation symporter [Vallitalea longa]GKX28181.1 melibiose:sodium transporter MelB [Vallitalea longa]